MRRRGKLGKLEKRINDSDYCWPSADYCFFVNEGKRNPQSQTDIDNQEKLPRYETYSGPAGRMSYFVQTLWSRFKMLALSC